MRLLDKNNGETRDDGHQSSDPEVRATDRVYWGLCQADRVYHVAAAALTYLLRVHMGAVRHGNPIEAIGGADPLILIVDDVAAQSPGAGSPCCGRPGTKVVSAGSAHHALQQNRAEFRI